MLPMVVTVDGIVRELSPEQQVKAPSIMVATELGNSMARNPPQLEKAATPMVMTLPGMVLLLQPQIRVLVAVSIMALQSSRES